MCQRISPNLYNFLKSKFSIDIFSEWVPIWENVENLQYAVKEKGFDSAHTSPSESKPFEVDLLYKI